MPVEVEVKEELPIEDTDSGQYYEGEFAHYLLAESESEDEAGLEPDNDNLPAESESELDEKVCIAPEVMIKEEPAEGNLYLSKIQIQGTAH